MLKQTFLSRPSHLFIAIAAVAALLAFVLTPCPAFAQLTPPDGMSIAIGGFDPGNASDVPGLVAQLKDALPRMKAAGATSHEGYVRWNLIEPEPGQFDFSVYDAFVELYKEYDMKWVPFLIIGSPYSLPDWFYDSDENVGYVCLEHGKKTDIQSLWSPHMRGHIERVIAAFADHYRDSGVIESVLLGVTGNYGEAIYPATGSDWTGSIHGEYHGHRGYWAGDKFAIADFQSWLNNKYSTVAALNQAWKSDIAAFDQVRPMLPEDAPSDRARVDFIQWYRGAMNDFTDFWVATTRRNFPDTPIFICTGGDAHPSHGSDFAVQAKIAARHNAGVRITNEASDYALNFTITRWVASAGRFYGAYYGFEPAGNVDDGGIVARFFNAAASGVDQLHSYYPNIFGDPKRQANWERDFPAFRKLEPVIDIALFYSKASRALGAEFYAAARELRDYFDYEIADEGMIADGFLKNIKLLIWPDGAVTENETFAAIAQWIENGGTTLYYASSGPMRTPDGAAPANWPDALSAATNADTIEKINRSAAKLSPKKAAERLVLNYGKGHLVLVPNVDQAQTMFGLDTPVQDIVKWLFTGKLGFEFSSAEAVDPEKDKIFFSVVDGGKTLMALSQADQPKEKTILVGGKMMKIMTEPDQIVEVAAP